MDGGQQAWLLDGQLLTQIGINAVVGQDRSALMVEPTRFDQMRERAFDIAACITDMDADGVYASMSFPSLVGFAGVRLQAFPDQDYGLAVLRAWNDWHLEEWAGTYPGRMIPCQIPWLNDPQIAAEEIAEERDRLRRVVETLEAGREVFTIRIDRQVKENEELRKAAQESAELMESLETEMTELRIELQAARAGAQAAPASGAARSDSGRSEAEARYSALSAERERERQQHAKEVRELDV